MKIIEKVWNEFNVFKVPNFFKKTMEHINLLFVFILKWLEMIEINFFFKIIFVYLYNNIMWHYFGS
jgi:hypothetical protein